MSEGRDSGPGARPATVAVTGATGFVGRHVVEALERRGIRPTLVVRPASTIPEQWSHLDIVRVDVAAAPADSYARLGSPEVLIHLAWDGLPDYRSAHHLERELPAQAAFLRGLVAEGLPSLTVTGTCFEYGLQSGALHEDLPTRPETAYGAAKDELRREVERLREQYAFHLTWARLFYLHGPGQAKGSLLPQLEAAIARGDASFDMSAGDQLRDYLPVTTAAEHLVTLALNGRDNGLVNVCSGCPISVRDLVERVVHDRRSDIRLNLGRYPYPEYEPMAFWGDRRKLSAILGDE